MIDSDCGLTRGVIDRLTEASATENKPVQGLYSTIAPR
jgi:hypothetical protein